MKKMGNPVPPGAVKPAPPPAPPRKRGERAPSQTPMQVPVPVKVKKKVREKHNEEHLRKKMKNLGGECYKWQSLNSRGVADRICVFPDGLVAMVELKRDKTCKLSPLQIRFHDRMAELGVPHVYVLHTKDEIDQWLIGMGY